MYDKIPDELKQKYINCFQTLKPINQLQEKINNYSKCFTENTISVHIRSWNRNGEKSRRTDLFNLHKFENMMNNYKTSLFYLATDSKKVQDYFKNDSKLRDRILIYPRTKCLNTSRDSYQGVQEDLIELYLLSKNKIIIGSHFSTFTEVAWWLGGCTKNIVIL